MNLKKMQNLDLSKLNVGREQLATLKNVQSVLAKLDVARSRSCKSVDAQQLKSALKSPNGSVNSEGQLSGHKSHQRVASSSLKNVAPPDRDA